MKIVQLEGAAALYLRGHSLRDAAHEAGVSKSGLQGFMKRKRIDRRDRGKSIGRHQQRMMVRMHHEEKRSLREIGEAFNVDRKTVREVILRDGKMIYTAKQMRRFARARRDAEFLGPILELDKQGHSSNQIARKLHTDARRVRRVLQEARNAA